MTDQTESISPYAFDLSNNNSADPGFESMQMTYPICRLDARTAIETAGRGY